MALKNFLLFLIFCAFSISTNLFEPPGSIFGEYFSSGSYSIDFQYGDGAATGDQHPTVTDVSEKVTEKIFIEVLENEEELEHAHDVPAIRDFKKSVLSRAWQKCGMTSYLITTYVNTVRKHIILQVFRN